MRGGDLVTLVVAVPLLVVGMIQAMRGSGRAAVLWLGMLWYLVYAYAFYVVGAEFNDLFLVHVGIVVGSATALGLLLRRLDATRLGSWLAPATLARPVAVFLLAVAAIMAGLLSWISLRFAVTGDLPGSVPAEGFHTVFAVDLCLLVPSLVLSGLLLWRRVPAGYALAAAVSVFGAVYQLNLMSAAVFQSAADVPDTTRLSVQGVALTVLFAGSAAALMRRPGTSTQSPVGRSSTLEVVTKVPAAQDF